MAGADIGALLKCSSPDVLSQFVHLWTDDLVSGNHRNLNSSLGVDWTETDHEKARSLVHKFYRDCAVNNKDSQIEGMPTNFQQVMTDCYRVRQNEVIQAIAKDSLLSSGTKNLVENIDWRLKWIMGSSKLATLREPVLQMNISCIEKSESNSDTKNIVDFEMNLEQVNKLIDTLEKAKSVFSSNTVSTKNE